MLAAPRSGIFRADLKRLSRADGCNIKWTSTLQVLTSGGALGEQRQRALHGRCLQLGSKQQLCQLQICIRQLHQKAKLAKIVCVGCEGEMCMHASALSVGGILAAFARLLADIGI